MVLLDASSERMLLSKSPKLVLERLQLAEKTQGADGGIRSLAGRSFSHMA